MGDSSVVASSSSSAGGSDAHEVRAHALRRNLLGGVDLETEGLGIERERCVEVVHRDSYVVQHRLHESAASCTNRRTSCAAAVYGSTSREAMASIASSRPRSAPMRLTSRPTRIDSRRVRARRTRAIRGYRSPPGEAPHRRDHAVDAVPGSGAGLHHRRPPPARSALAQRQHPFDLGDRTVGAVPIRLVHHEHVGYLHDAGLDRLNIIAAAGRENHDRHIGRPADVDLSLADADGLYQHDVRPRRVEDDPCVVGRPRQPAELPAGRHAAHEDPVVGRMPLHPDAVAEYRAAGERTLSDPRPEHRPAAAPGEERS